MILTRYLYVGVRYRRDNGISREVAPFSVVARWIKVVVVNRCWKQWTVVDHGRQSTPWAVFHNSPLHLLVAYEELYQNSRSDQ
jgi:hypothetical protein